MKNRWSLVIHEVTEHSVNIWVGSLFNDLRKPQTVSVLVYDKANILIADINISKDDWERPFSKITHQRFYKLITINQLIAGSDYSILLKETTHHNINNTPTTSHIPLNLAKGSFTTLPKSISDMPNGFTVGLGSCFYEEFDGGNASLAYEKLIHYRNFPYKPHIKFLSGDQVYLDIGWDSLSFIPNEIRDRVANDYAIHWQALRGILRHGGTWFVSDDHEFWNNYPLVQGYSPFIQALHMPSVKRAWLSTAKDGVNNIQRVAPVKIFSIGNDVSYCVADLRAFRNKTNVMPDKYFKKILSWLAELSYPGVLVLSQPIMEALSNDEDRNFVYYQRQYKQIVKAIHDANHDVLVLSGDVHHGRISTVEFPERKNKLVEVVSSPMSNLSGLSSIATSVITQRSRLKVFPPIGVRGVPSSDIQYKVPWRVSSESNTFDYRYFGNRTKEHFFTITFKKQRDNSLNVTVRAWLVREQDKKTGLPKQNWKESPMEFVLN